MKFTAKKIDLRLELVTLSGEAVIKDIEGNMTAREAMNRWTRINSEELAFQKLPPSEQTPEAVMNMVVGQISEFYPPTPPSWWLDNIDLGTVKDIKIYIVQQLQGLKKNVNS